MKNCVSEKSLSVKDLLCFYYSGRAGYVIGTKESCSSWSRWHKIEAGWCLSTQTFVYSSCLLPSLNLECSSFSLHLLRVMFFARSDCTKSIGLFSL